MKSFSADNEGLNKFVFPWWNPAKDCLLIKLPMLIIHTQNRKSSLASVSTLNANEDRWHFSLFSLFLMAAADCVIYCRFKVLNISLSAQKHSKKSNNNQEKNKANVCQFDSLPLSSTACVPFLVWLPWTVLNFELVVVVFWLIFTWVSGCFVLWPKPLRHGHVTSAEWWVACAKQPSHGWKSTPVHWRHKGLCVWLGGLASCVLVKALRVFKDGGVAASPPAAAVDSWGLRAVQWQSCVMLGISQPKEACSMRNGAAHTATGYSLSNGAEFQDKTPAQSCCSNSIHMLEKICGVEKNVRATW